MAKGLVCFKFKKLLIFIIFFSGMLALFACQSNMGVELKSSDILNMNIQSDPKDYVLGCGDVITIKFLYNSNLNDEVTIGPDGKISLHLIDQVKAAGLTIPELDSLLTAKYYKVLGYSMETYTLGVGDTITVKFLYNSSLNDEVKIRPDGKVSLHLIDEVKAAGLTVTEFDTLLTPMYYKILGYSMETYTLGVGDIITVKLLYNNELNDEVKIRPDGKISLALIGEIKAAGLTPAQLESMLTDKYSKQLDSQEMPKVTVNVKDVKLPELTVNVKDFRLPELAVMLKESPSQVIYIGGEVAQPGMLTIRGTVKMLDAMIRVGGARNSAELNNVILIRYNGSQKPDVHSISLNKVLSGKSPDVILKPYDIVYVPKNVITELELFMQHLYRILPVSVVFSFPYNLNPKSEIEIR